MPALRYFAFALSMICMIPTMAQPDTMYLSLSNKEINNNSEIRLADALTIFKDRYAQALKTGDTESQLEHARYVVDVLYRSGEPKDLPHWHNIIDSLRQGLKIEGYDPEYGIHLISYYHSQKNFNKVKNLLSALREPVFSSGDTSLMIRYLIKRVRAFNSNDDQAEALKDLLKAEQLNEAYGDPLLSAHLLISRGDIYWEQRNNQKSLEKYIEAVPVLEKEHNTQNLLPLYRNIITQAIMLKEKELALDYSDRLSQLQKSTGSEIGYFTGEENKIFFLIQLEEYTEAVRQAERTIALADSTGRDAAHATYLMGVAYRGLDKFDKAEALIEHAFDLGKNIGHTGNCSFYAHALYQTYYWKEKYAPALKWYKTHITYRDSVYNEEKAKEIAVYESRLEALEQKRQVEFLEAKVALDRQKKKWLWTIILLGGTLGLIFAYAQRQRALREKIRQQALLDKQSLENEKLKQQLEFKQREITTQVLHMSQMNSLLSEVTDKVSALKSEENKTLVNRLLRNINQSLQNTNNWDKFYMSFKSIHSSFLESLKKLGGELSANDIRLASLMKMNLSSKEIATLLNVSDAGIKKARYRLRKKLGIESDVSLQDYLVQL